MLRRAGRIHGGSAKCASSLLLAVGALALTAAAASAGLVYDNIPGKLPGSMYTVGAEEYKINEFGGQVGLEGTERKRPTIEVVMSTKACQFGQWNQETCETPRSKKTFKWPVTLNVYEVGPGNSVGSLIESVTKSIKIPYRPSKSPKQCTGGRWYDSTDNKCYNGMVFVSVFKLGKLHAHLGTIPTDAIISVVYNSEKAGPEPVGPAACDSTSGGCPYNYLNVAITEPNEKTLSVGTQPAAPDIYLNTENPEYFEQIIEPGYINCYGGEPPFVAAAPIGVPGKFSLNNCLASMQPVFKVSASS